MKFTNKPLMTLLLAVLMSFPIRAIDTIVVESVANMQSLATMYASDAYIIEVLDYYPITSGSYRYRGRGGGKFRWVTDIPQSAADGGRWIAHNSLTNGLWERDFQGQIPNVKMWGAKGDFDLTAQTGTDDTDAIRRAVRGVNKGEGLPSGHSMGNQLLFPSGVYLVSDTIHLFRSIYVQGEGSHGATVIVMSDTVTNKNIFETDNATAALKGGLWRATDDDDIYNVDNERVDWDVGLAFENLWLQFGYDNEDFGSLDTTGAGICLALPAECGAIRNVFVRGGGFGIRVLGGGTPGLRLENCGFDWQSRAGVCIEGLEYTQSGVTKWVATGGPIVLKSIGGDSYDDKVGAPQAANNSLVLFTNFFPNATIIGMAAEGGYGKGVVRCVVPPSSINMTWGQITIQNGDFYGSESGITKTLVTLENPYSTPDSVLTRMPIVTIEPIAGNGISYLIKDLWAGRNIEAYNYNSQVPVRRPIIYTSAGTSGTEKRSLLVIGDTAYYHFVPEQTGWYRVVMNTLSYNMMGGRLAINSYYDSSEVSFNYATGSGEMTIERTSTGSSPFVSAVRGYTFDQAYAGSNYPRHAIDIYVDTVPSTAWVADHRPIVLTLPLEGRTEISSGLSNLIDPIYLGGASTDDYPSPAQPNESNYRNLTADQSLLR